MNREYHKWWSSHLQRDMELLIFGHAGEKVLIFPSRDGRFYEYEQLGIVTRLEDKLTQGHLQLYCLDNIYHESFYCEWAHPEGRIQRHKAFEAYVLEEILPFMAEKNNHPITISHGLSLGAFYAVNIVMRHPQLFNKLVAFSGRYDLTLNVEFFKDLFDGFYNEDIYYHTPNHFLPNLECPELLDRIRKIDITLVIGNEDPFLENNYQFSEILHHKQINHQLIIWEGRAHTGKYWRQMAPLYL